MTVYPFINFAASAGNKWPGSNDIYMYIRPLPVAVSAKSHSLFTFSDPQATGDDVTCETI